jgi:hypothetical protein
MAALGWLAIVAFVVVGLYYADRQIDPASYETDPDDLIEKERREWM